MQKKPLIFRIELPGVRKAPVGMQRVGFWVVGEKYGRGEVMVKKSKLEGRVHTSTITSSRQETRPWSWRVKKKKRDEVEL